MGRCASTRADRAQKMVVSGKGISCDGQALVSVFRFLPMNIASAIFDRSAPDLGSCPDESLPEFAFIGRSNVGKSSLLNMLAGKRDLARVSKTPGFTKMINIFTMNKTWRLVDLPGYGFAHVAREDKAKFNQAVADYLQHRANLCCVFTLIDSSLPPQKLDLEFVEWLIDSAIPFVLVFTKTDTVKPAVVQANLAAFTERIAEWSEKLPEIFTSSATTRQGRTELLALIAETVAAERGEESAAAGGPSSDGAREADEVSAAGQKLTNQGTQVRRPNPARPW